MSLKQRIIDAKIKAYSETFEESIEIDTSNGSLIDKEAQYISEAIIETLKDTNFTITQLKAPVIVETFKSSEQSVNIELATLLGDKAPILRALKSLPIPAIGEIVDKLEGEIQKAITPLLEGGAKMVGMDIDNNTGLQSTGYVYIGEDPESSEKFNVDDEDGQKIFTTVKLTEEEAERIK